MNFYQQKYFKPYQQLVQSPERILREQNFRTPSTHKYRHPEKGKYIENYKIEPVWEYLYNEGLKNQKQLMQKHELSKSKIDTECTFKPIIKHNKRYLIPSHSTFLQRNNLWLENKIQKIVKEKEEEISKGLKECTFSPHINPKSKNTKADKYENKIHKKACPNEKLHKSAMKPRLKESVVDYQFYDRQETTKRTSYMDGGRAKQMIKNELKRLVL